MKSDVVKGWPGFSLTADDQGFMMRYPLGRSRYRWSDIDGDFVVVPSGVGFRLKPTARRSFVRRFVGGFQRAIVGFDGVIQTRTYQLYPAELHHWLTEWRTPSDDNT